jgi:hypothetical protein
LAAKKIVRRGWNLSKSDAGSIIRFIYREYKNDMARPAFTQNLVSDAFAAITPLRVALHPEPARHTEHIRRHPVPVHF